MRGQDKEIRMAATTLGYNNLPNRDSSSSSPTVGQRSSDQPQNSHHHHHHHHLYPTPLAPNQNQQPQIHTTDPDLSSSPVTNTTTGTTPITPRTVTVTAPSKIWYRECMKNHAASMGSHVVDGCGEFMPSGDEGTPESLKCAACECHRNFHRREVEGEQQPQPQHSQPQNQHQHVPNYQSYYPNNNKHNNGHLQFPTPPPPSLSLPHQHHRFSHVLPTHTAGVGPIPPLMMAFGGPAESSSEDLNMFQCNNAGAQVSVQAQPVSKKRFRTKFSQQQKDSMMEFAEKLGWKIQKHDEQEVQQFCSQIGIRRQVFKVWMHNNKQALKKQQM